MDLKQLNSEAFAEIDHHLQAITSTVMKQVLGQVNGLVVREWLYRLVEVLEMAEEDGQTTQQDKDLLTSCLCIIEYIDGNTIDIV